MLLWGAVKPALARSGGESRHRGLPPGWGCELASGSPMPGSRLWPPKRSESGKGALGPAAWGPRRPQALPDEPQFLQPRARDCPSAHPHLRPRERLLLVPKRPAARLLLVAAMRFFPSLMSSLMNLLVLSSSASWARILSLNHGLSR